MGFARAADVPVVLLGDIDRGGVIASLVGTKAVIDPADADDDRGLHRQPLPRRSVIVRRRHEVRRAAHRLAGAWAWCRSSPRPIDCRPKMRVVLQDRHGRRRRGQASHRRAGLSAHRQFRRFRSAAAGSRRRSRLSRAARAACRAMPRWSSCRARSRPSPISPRSRDAAGTSTSRAHLRRGGRVLGICGGYQMLGRSIADPHGIEGPPSKVDGLGLLDVETVLEGDKVLVEVTGETAAAACRSRATKCMSGARPAADRSRCCSSPTATVDGAVSADGRVAGCYIHGLLADDRQRAALAGAHRRRRPRASPTRPTSTRRSTCWPTISRSMSIATGCSRWRDRPLLTTTGRQARTSDREHGELQPAGRAIESQRHADIARAKRRCRPSPTQRSSTATPS